MARRDLKQIEPLMQRDLRLDYRHSGGFFEDADLATLKSERSARRERDLATIDGLGNLEQAIANRLKTRKGELAPLGHPGYGSRHHELIGEPNTERTRDQIKIYVLQALRDEPRIERVLAASVRAEQSPPRDTVRIELKLKIIGEQAPVTLAVRFSLEASA
jgi:phage baseplate assembly protein W